MTAIIEVKRLERQIDAAEARIREIEKQCKHQRILHIEKPDVNCGWSVSDKCLQCGKMIMVATTIKSDGRKPVRKIIKSKQ